MKFSTAAQHWGQWGSSYGIFRVISMYQNSQDKIYEQWGDDQCFFLHVLDGA
jgi:hypothetical protein